MNGDVFYMLPSTVMLDMNLLGIVAVVVLFLLMIRFKDFVLSVFTSTMSLVVGVSYLGFDVWSIGWFLGICLVLFCIYVLFMGVIFVFTGQYTSVLRGRDKFKY